MAEQIRTKNTVDIRRRSESTDQLLSSSAPQSKEKNDDLIIALSDAYENRRAQQVGEWERLYQHNVYRAI